MEMVSKEEFREYAKIVTNENSKEIKHDLRKPIINKIKYIIYVLFILLVIRVFVFSGIESKAYLFFYIAIIILGVLFSVYETIEKKRKNKKYTKNYKNEIVKYLLDGYKYLYNNKRYIRNTEYDYSPMYKRYDNYTGEDYLCINIDNKDNEPSKCFLYVSDIYTNREVKDDDGNVHYIDVFNGTFGYVDFNDNFKESLYLNCPIKQKKDNLVKLENLEFNEKFKIYCRDQVEARYILTPNIMENILALNELISNQCKSKSKSNISLALVENRMYFAFSGGFKLFDLKRERLETGEVFDNFYDDINIILKIIEEIKNNNKIFKI